MELRHSWLGSRNKWYTEETINGESPAIWWDEQILLAAFTSSCDAPVSSLASDKLVVVITLSSSAWIPWLSDPALLDLTLVRSTGIGISSAGDACCRWNALSGNTRNARSRFCVRISFEIPFSAVITEDSIIRQLYCRDRDTICKTYSFVFSPPNNGLYRCFGFLEQSLATICPWKLESGCMCQQRLFVYHC